MGHPGVLFKAVMLLAKNYTRICSIARDRIRFLLGTGRMPHLVGGFVGASLHASSLLTYTVPFTLLHPIPCITSVLGSTNLYSFMLQLGRLMMIIIVLAISWQQFHFKIVLKPSYSI